MKAYYAAFIPDEGKFSVLFPDLPGCQTWGNTLEESFGHSVEALAGHLEAMAADGDVIPEPSLRDKAWEELQSYCAELEIELPEGTVFQLVPAPELDLSPIRISVSFKRYTLEMIDRKAEASGMTRSGFLAAAAAACDIGGHGSVK